MDGAHRRDWQRPIEMREEGPAPRRLPFKRRAQGGSIDGKEDEIRLPGAVLGDTLHELAHRREMDEAVAPVVRRALIAPGGARRLPVRAAADVIDNPLGHGGEARCLVTRPTSPSHSGGTLPPHPPGRRGSV